MYINNETLFNHWDRFVKYGYEMEDECGIKILEGYTSGINAIYFKFLKNSKIKEISIMIDSNNIPPKDAFKSFFKQLVIQ